MPPQLQYPAPVPPKKRTKKPLILTLVAVLVLAGVGIGLAVSGVFNSAPPEDPGAAKAGISGVKQKLWSASSVGSDDSSVSGGWVVDNHSVVYVADTVITGYDLNTGKKLWQFRPPTGMKVCDKSPTADNGVGAVGYGPDKDHCPIAAAIDLKAGKQLWQTQLTLPDNFHGFDHIIQAMSVADSTVVVNDPATTFGYDARTGQQRWTTQPPSERDDEGNCTSINALATGDQTAELFDCDLDGVKEASYDTATGATKWTTQASQDEAPGSWWLLSANPVVAVDARTGIYYLSGQDAAPVPVGRTYSSIGFPSSSYQYGMALFNGNTMFTVDSDEGSTPSMHQALTLTAYNVTTGKAQWQHKFDTDASVALIDINEQNVRVTYTAPDASEDQLLSFNLHNGTMTRGGTIDSATEEDDNQQPLSVHLIGTKVVRFSSPKNPVTVWG